MNRVSGVTGNGLTTGRTKTAAAAGGFSVADNNAAEPLMAQETQAAQSPALAGMLNLQEAETGLVQDRAARRHGFALLEALAQLQKELLSSLGHTATEVSTLTRLLAEMPNAADPGLVLVLDAVRLRAKIELLRRGVEFT